MIASDLSTQKHEMLMQKQYSKLTFTVNLDRVGQAFIFFTHKQFK